MVASMASMRNSINFTKIFKIVFICFDIQLHSSASYTDFSLDAVAQKIEEDLKNNLQKLNDSQIALANEKQMNTTLRSQVFFSLKN